MHLSWPWKHSKSSLSVSDIGVWQSIKGLYTHSNSRGRTGTLFIVIGVGTKSTHMHTNHHHSPFPFLSQIQTHFNTHAHMHKHIYRNTGTHTDTYMVHSHQDILYIYTQRPLTHRSKGMQKKRCTNTSNRICMCMHAHKCTHTLLMYTLTKHERDKDTLKEITHTAKTHIKQKAQINISHKCSHTHIHTVLIMLATKIQWNQLQLCSPGKSALGFNPFLPAHGENKVWPLFWENNPAWVLDVQCI